MRRLLRRAPPSPSSLPPPPPPPTCIGGPSSAAGAIRTLRYPSATTAAAPSRSRERVSLARTEYAILLMSGARSSSAAPPTPDAHGSPRVGRQTQMRLAHLLAVAPVLAHVRQQLGRHHKGAGESVSAVALEHARLRQGRLVDGLSHLEKDVPRFGARPRRGGHETFHERLGDTYTQVPMGVGSRQGCASPRAAGRGDADWTHLPGISPDHRSEHREPSSLQPPLGYDRLWCRMSPGYRLDPAGSHLRAVDRAGPRCAHGTRRRCAWRRCCGPS